MQMTDTKERRQRAIVEIIGSGALSSQEELARQLWGLGFEVTQATISRDLDQIGALKVRRAGQLSYALPQEVPGAARPRLANLLRDYVRSIDTAVNLVVIKTPPGSAHLIGVALDQSDFSQIVGTICGDDTIFVACRSGAAAKNFEAELRAAGSRS
jgi:transcriptional regulator of arginine metabolism